MIVRQALIGDIEELSVLFDDYRVFYEQSSDIKKAKSFLVDRFNNKESIILVAEEGNKLVGFTQLFPTFSSVSLERFYILNDLYVSPNFRKKGVGKLLLNSAQDLIRKMGYKGLSLETANDNPAQHLYEREGWKVDQDYLHMFWKREDK